MLELMLVMFSFVVITAMTLATLQNIFPDENDYVIIAEDIANLVQASRKFGRLHMLHDRLEFDGVEYSDQTNTVSLTDAQNPQNISSYCGFLSLNPEETTKFQVSGTEAKELELIHPFMLTYDELVNRGLAPAEIDADWPDGIGMASGEPIQLRTKEETHTDLYTKYKSIADTENSEDLNRDEIATMERLCYRFLNDTTVAADQHYTSDNLILRTTLTVPDTSTSTALVTYLRRYFEEAIHCQRIQIDEEVSSDQHQVFLDIPANETSTQIAC